jgi:endonuclease YncB( thermonuclease family)
LKSIVQAESTTLDQDLPRSGCSSRARRWSLAILLLFALAQVPPASGAGEPFGSCVGGSRDSCVIDGDTIVHQGVRIRMVDFDAPEILTPKCAREEELGQRARLRLGELLSGGTIRIVTSGKRDEDRYGRKLRLVTVNGRSVGDILIEEGLAWPWEGRRHDWCRLAR